MINENNTNNFTEVNINYNNTPKKDFLKEKNVFKLKKVIKNSYSSLIDSKFMRRMNLESSNTYSVNNNKNNNNEILNKERKYEKCNDKPDYGKMYNNKNSKSFLINKLVENAIKKTWTNEINCKNISKFKNDNNNIKNHPILTPNPEENLINSNYKETKNQKIIKISNSNNKLIVNSLLENNKKTENSTKNKDIPRSIKSKKILSILKERFAKNANFNKND